MSVVPFVRPKITPPTPPPSPKQRARLSWQNRAAEEREHEKERRERAAYCQKNGNPEAMKEALDQADFYAESAAVLEAGLTVTAPKDAKKGA